VRFELLSANKQSRASFLTHRHHSHHPRQMVQVEKDPVLPAQTHLALGEGVRAQRLEVLCRRVWVSRKNALHLAEQNMGGFPIKPPDVVERITGNLNPPPACLLYHDYNSGQPISSGFGTKSSPRAANSST
jgi:hypothetical protein